MKKYYKPCMALILVFIMVMVAACGPAGGGGGQTPGAAQPPGGQEAGAQTRETLMIAISSEPTSLDPYAHSLINGFLPSSLIYDTLIVPDGHGGFAGALATDWRFESPTQIVFELRQGVVFHNGNPFSAYDVKETLIVARTSTFSNTLFANVDIDNINVLDRYTIEVNLTYPFAPLLDVLASYRAGIIDSVSYLEDPAAFGRNPVGTGPMMLSNWVSGDRIELVENPNYWGEPLGFAACTFRVILEATSRTIELETGGIHIAGDVAFSDWNRIENDPNLQLVRGQVNSMTTLVFNNSHELFGNYLIRRALSYGINREALVRTVWEGTADVATSFYAAHMLGHQEQGPFVHDPDRARELLAEAGFPDGFAFTFTTFETALNRAFSEVLQNMWANIGITMSIDIVDVATFTQMNNAGELTVALMTPNIAISDPAIALILYPITRTISLRHGNQHIQDLLDKGAMTYDTEARIAIYQELQQFLFERLYTIPMAYPTAAFGLRGNVEGFTFDPSQVPNFRTVIIN